MPHLPDADLSVPVVHQGELLGAISITMPKDEPLHPAGRQLMTDVADQAGLVLSNAGLIEDLRASRQRLVTAQDEARRRLERNIHDGAQQDLVALGINLKLAGITVAGDPAQAELVFTELQADAAGALENLRDLARGIYPPLLADLGLAAALSAQASKSRLPVTVEADGVGRFGQDTEAAVYFCCLEALQNTAKYAHATQARICLQAQNGTLWFTVSDDGAGYDDATPRWARGCGTWPTGWPRLAVGWRSTPPPARAPPSPGTCLSALARQLRQASPSALTTKPDHRIRQGRCPPMRPWPQPQVSDHIRQSGPILQAVLMSLRGKAHLVSGLECGCALGAVCESREAPWTRASSLRTLFVRSTLIGRGCLRHTEGPGGA